MTLCKDCQWWDLSGERPEGMGSCKIIRFSGSYGQDKAYTEFGYELITRPDFGCVLGAPKGNK